MNKNEAAFEAPSAQGSSGSHRDGTPLTVHVKPGQVARITIDIVIGDASDVIGGGHLARGARPAPTFKLVPVEPPREEGMSPIAMSGAPSDWTTMSGDSGAVTPEGTSDFDTPEGSFTATPEGTSDFAFPMEP